MPVIMCSSLTQRGARVTIEALACGASDYVTKPTGQSSREAALDALAGELVPKIHALSRLRSRGRPSSNRRGLLFRSGSHASGPQPYFLVPIARSPQQQSLAPAAHHGNSVRGRHRRLHRRPCRSRCPAPPPPGHLSSARSHRPAHARALHAPLRRSPQRPLQTARARSCRRRPGRPRNHLHRARQLAS